MGQAVALVDDDRNILASVSMALEAEGFKVRTYVDGEQALRGIAAQPVDLAVLDIKMPRMDGMELLQRLRAQGKLPVIFLTSKDDEVDEVLGLRMGAAYGEHIYVDDRTIDSHIKRLRRKFKAVDPEFGEIETLYGVGYRYRA